MKKKLTKQNIENIETEVILLLLNCIQVEEIKGNHLYNANNPYYAEAFGVLRGVTALGYTFFGSVNLPTTRQNACWWFDECKTQAEKIKNELGIEEAILLYQQKHYDIYHKTKYDFYKNVIK